MFHTQIANALEAIRQVTSIDVVYEREGVQIDGLKATPGKSSFDSTDASGVQILSESKDFIFAATDLQVDEEEFIPERGDRIIEGDFTYEVMTPLGSEDCWKYSDSQRSTIRIHTKLVGC